MYHSRKYNPARQKFNFLLKKKIRGGNIATQTSRDLNNMTTKDGSKLSYLAREIKLYNQVHSSNNSIKLDTAHSLFQQNWLVGKKD